MSAKSHQILQNRQTAGRDLAVLLRNYRGRDAHVVALPRGGIPVAAEIARALNLPLSLLFVRKIASPYQPEFALGAICEDDEVVWNVLALSQLALEPEDFQNEVETARREVRRMQRELRKNPIFIKERTVILVDDGLATGTTIHAAIRYLRKHFPIEEIVVAVPVATAQALRVIQLRAQKVVSLLNPKRMRAVSDFYVDFPEVGTQEMNYALKSELPFESPPRPSLQ